jgi:hypothetical protein
MNRRRRSRASFRARVRFFIAGGEVLISDSKDLSLNGVYLFSSERPEPGIEGEVELVLAVGEHEVPLRMPGRVVRRDETGIAVGFLEMDPVVFDHLKKVLYYNTGDPENIDAELFRFPFGASGEAGGAKS